MLGLGAVGKQLSLAISGVTSLTVQAGARHAIIGIDTANVRWTHDASNPHATDGVQAPSTSYLHFMDPEIDYYIVLVALRFIEETGSPVLQVLYFD